MSYRDFNGTDCNSTVFYASSIPPLQYSIYKVQTHLTLPPFRIPYCSACRMI